MKKISWRDEFGIFFDSAERHDSQCVVRSRADESAWIANLLPDAYRGDDSFIHGHFRNVKLNTCNRSGISLEVGTNDFGGVVPPDFGE